VPLWEALVWQGMSRQWSCATLAAGDAMLEGAAGNPEEGSTGPPLKRVKIEPCDVDIRKRMRDLEMELAELKALI